MPESVTPFILFAAVSDFAAHVAYNNGYRRVMAAKMTIVQVILKATSRSFWKSLDDDSYLRVQKP